jgi:hypothetical protein
MELRRAPRYCTRDPIMKNACAFLRLKRRVDPPHRRRARDRRNCSRNVEGWRRAPRSCRQAVIGDFRRGEAAGNCAQIMQPSRHGMREGTRTLGLNVKRMRAGLDAAMERRPGRACVKFRLWRRAAGAA